MVRRFPVAPWTLTLKLVSVFATVALLGTAVAAYQAAPSAAGFTRSFGIGVAALPVLLLLGAFWYQVTGYAIEDDQLCVHRLLTATRIPLKGLRRAWAEPAICKGSIRVWGNGGMFAFTGLYYSKALGRYRLFATDLSRAVVLELPDRVVVLTPEDPEGFLAHLRHRFPKLETGD